MSSENTAVVTHALAVVAGLVLAVAGYELLGFRSLRKSGGDDDKYSMPNQPARFAKGKAEKNVRMLELEKIYKPEYCRGKKVLVTGGNRGLGYAIAKEFASQGAMVMITSRKPTSIDGITVFPGIDVTDDKCGEKLVACLKGITIDILVNNAGYFYGPAEKMDCLNFKEELSMIDICAVGPLRITAALYNAGLLKAGAKVSFISTLALML